MTIIGRKKRCLGVIILFVFATSCVNTRKATYFNDVGDQEFKNEVESLEPVLAEERHLKYFGKQP